METHDSKTLELMREINASGSYLLSTETGFGSFWINYVGGAVQPYPLHTEPVSLETVSIWWNAVKKIKIKDKIWNEKKKCQII